MRTRITDNGENWVSWDLNHYIDTNNIHTHRLCFSLSRRWSFCNRNENTDSVSFHHFVVVQMKTKISEQNGSQKPFSNKESNRIRGLIRLCHNWITSLFTQFIHRPFRYSSFTVTRCKLSYTIRFGVDAWMLALCWAGSLESNTVIWNATFTIGERRFNGRIGFNITSSRHIFRRETSKMKSESSKLNN